MTFYNKYKWIVPSMLFCSALLVARMIYTGSFTFIFLLWNLFLAVLPLYFTYKLEQASSKMMVLGLAALWLLFFPNAMYITTDLFHLRERADCPYWYDLLLLLSFAFNGMLLGFMSLTTIEKLLRGYVKPKYIGFILFLLLCLCGYGIYLGRYLRWNSWDIVITPLSLLLDIGYHIIHPFRNWEVWMLSSLFGCWMYMLYRYIKRVEWLNN